MIGRGTRRYPGKEDCLVIDLLGATSRHDLLTTAEPFKVKPDSLATRPLREALEGRETQSEEELTPPTSGKLVSRDVELFQSRALHWVAAGGDGFVLSLGAAG
jgi:ATP-dependent helicase IRC3